MQSMSKHVQINDWIFEVKAVRALRVGKYGEPYSAITHININGDSAYLDGLITKKDEAFTRHDFETLKEFCRQLEVTEANFDRFKNNQLKSEKVIIEPKHTASILPFAK